MALFFARDFAKEFDSLTPQLAALKERFNVAAQTQREQEHEQQAKAFSDAANDIDTIISNYRRYLINSGSSFRKESLLKEYEELIQCLQNVADNPREYNASDLIERITLDNQYLPCDEIATRIFNALTALFWLGVAVVGSIAGILSLSTVPADTIGGVVATGICVGLVTYASIEMIDNLCQVFEPHHTFTNTREINDNELTLLGHVHEAYGIAPTM
ncbi:Uncharacterised protein [Legionella lansingensis]|uniref:DUF5638 domain-containing protein n=1 Tax=Legionella lansingensis TaxID=45067 RepID=A0A0W0V7B0_9GAMM|nr:hypothetical protein [Legionella lansingensis]KTD15992.1 hypothetical protein Llan_2580 [Legionella lansingensis]SNV56387.1 Uncharacterised protein [Legionella lansingensis]